MCVGVVDSVALSNDTSLPVFPTEVIHKKRDDNAVRTKLVQAVKDVEKESDVS